MSRLLPNGYPVAQGTYSKLLVQVTKILFKDQPKWMPKHGAFILICPMTSTPINS